MEPLFAWQSREVWERVDWLDPDTPIDHADDVRVPGPWCPYCGEDLEYAYTWQTDESRTQEDNDLYFFPGDRINTFSCLFCGFFASLRDIWPPPMHEQVVTRALLRSFDINDVRVPLEVLGAYLESRGERLAELGWRRFEQLLDALFREHGYRVVLGRGTRDGGVDLILLHSRTGEPTLVQAKQHRRRIGVAAIRELRGVQLRENTGKAVLVAPAGFTLGAQREAKATKPRLLGFELDLMDADAIVRNLGVFRDRPVFLPDIDDRRERFRKLRRRRA